MKTKDKLKVIKPSWTNFGYCINCYNGCEHGCRYCYGMKVTHKTYSDWVKPVPRLQLPDLLRKDIEVLNQNPPAKAGIKDIMVSSITDCYQPIESQHRITRQVIKLLIENELPFTILTKSASVQDDIDLFRCYDKCKVGLTIVTLDDNIRQSLEPNASPIVDRIEALRKLNQAGISTYCSVEPILPKSNPIDIVDELRDYVDLFEFGKWNPEGDTQAVVKQILGMNYSGDYYIDQFKQINDYCDKNKINYCHAGHSERFLKANGVSIRRVTNERYI
ncbi:radical SAM protein [Chloroflexota bacterium]